MTAAYPPFLQNDPRFEAIGDVVREKLVFNAGGSASCHATPGQNDRLKIGGGLALASPFGTFRPPNISPDPVDGIGKWSCRSSKCPNRWGLSQPRSLGPA